MSALTVAAPVGCAGRMPAHVKILALVAYLISVVATPREMVWPYLLHLAILLLVVAGVRVPWQRLRGALALELPFVVFALVLPFVATGPRTAVLGVAVAEPGLWGAWSLLAKGFLSVLAATVLASTTRPSDLLDGLGRLRLPGQLVDIMRFMIRYVDVVAGQWHRMTVARTSRGFAATSPRSWLTLARALGTLFIACYERGERVHLAMLCRGYAGALPDVPRRDAAPSGWQLAAVVPLTSALVTAAAWSVS